MNRLRDHTIVLLTGGSLHLIGAAASFARMLTPSMVVLEDVDLVAHERMVPFGGSVSFQVLNERDGIGEDADVVFLLTTNRADLLDLRRRIVRGGLISRSRSGCRTARRAGGSSISTGAGWTCGSRTPTL